MLDKINKFLFSIYKKTNKKQQKSTSLILKNQDIVQKNSLKKNQHKQK